MDHDKPTDHSSATIVPTPESIVSALSEWMLPARWHLGEEGTLQLEGFVEIASSPHIPWLVIADGHTRYNVPVVVQEGPEPSNAAIARVGSWYVYDATEHPAGQRALLDLLRLEESDGGKTSGAALPMAHLSAVGHSATLVQFGEPFSAHKLTSEQSNTSIIYRFKKHPAVILKVFRVLAPGHNPDVELQQALDVTGTVPRQYGSARMHWSSEGRTEGADVVAAAEFLEGAHDAWQVFSAQLAESDGTLAGVGPSIHALGALTRTMHDELASAFPTVEATARRREELRLSWSSRARTAMDLVPDLESHEGMIETIYSAAEHVRWPALQRIHGDYHLGQVLETPGHRWFALDFEGEPLRPLAERTREDLALRDLAGMLRSFDYAAGAATFGGGDETLLASWSARAKEAFLAGYGKLSSEEHILLDALILDKALYEVAYEATERPTWLPIPLAGVSRLVNP